MDLKTIIHKAYMEIGERREGYNFFPEKRGPMLGNKAETLMRACLTEILGPNYSWPEEYNEIVLWLQDCKNKGLLLIGPCGTGKSVIISKLLPLLVAAVTETMRIPVLNAYDLNRREEKALYCSYWLAIDDIGVEGEKIEYGNRSMVFNQVVDQAERLGTMLFLSSNLTTEEIRQKYGERTYDRLRSLVKVIVLKGESFRK